MKKKILIYFACFLVINMANAQNSNKQLSQTLLWKISGNGLQEDSYLLLTSSSCEETIKITGKILKALQSIKTIVLEDNRADKSNTVKFQQSMLAQADTQKIKNILSPNEYQLFVKKLKDKGAQDDAIDQFNAFKASIIDKLLQADANPCETKIPERMEDVLKKYAFKNKIEYKEFYTIENIISEMDAHTKDYWRNSILYTLNNGDQLKEALQTKVAFYHNENIPGLQELYNTNNFFKLAYGDNVIKDHIYTLTSKIENVIKIQATLIAVNISDAVLNQNSVIGILENKGYSLNPVLN